MADTEETLGSINSSLQNMVEIQKKMMDNFESIDDKGLDPMYQHNKKIENISCPGRNKNMSGAIC